MYKQATQKTGEVLSLPPKWLAMYSGFITKNSSAVSQIESALRSLTYIIPGEPCTPTSLLDPWLTVSGRFRESEIASESRRCSVAPSHRRTVASTS
jgi:peroxin-16